MMERYSLLEEVNDPEGQQDAAQHKQSKEQRAPKEFVSNHFIQGRVSIDSNS